MIAFSVWNAMWVVFVTFVFVSVLMMLFNVIVDLFRDQSLSGWGKAGWALGLIVFPLLGSLVYLYARGDGMAQRAIASQTEAQETVDSYIRSVAGGPATELEKAAQLHAAGQISDDEYASLKAKILA